MASKTASTVANTTAKIVQASISIANNICRTIAAQAGAAHPLIATQGAADALANANTVGLYDVFGGNHLSSYEDTYEQAAYLHGRMVGDAAGMVQGGQEITSGGAFALATAETGGGAIAGGSVALHGAGMELVASKDIAWSLARLYQLNFAAVSDGSSEPKDQSSSPTETKEPLKYKSTKKHEEGGWGTKMDLDDKAATQVLNNSIQAGKQRYSWFKDKLYEFQPDNVGYWHGYPIKGNEAPTSVLKELMARGDFNKAQYKKLIKGK
ncbi:MAG: hypothetical protein P4L51_22655 [Puia sp.]|nr:hypothetical protein [Puia sp.]